MALRSSSQVFVRLQAFYVALFAVLGVYMQFFPVWLHDVAGLGKREVTLVQAGQILARTVAGPLWARRVDRIGRARGVLRGLCVATLCMLPAFFVGGGFLWVLSCCALFGCLYPPMHPILDSAAMQHAEERGFSYGRLRAWGSVSFLVVIIATGAVLERLPSAAILWIVLGGMVAVVLAAWALPDENSRWDGGGGGEPTPLRRMMAQPRVLLLLLSCGLVQGSHGTYYALSTLHWRGHGIGEGAAGLLWAEGVLAEILLFFCARRFLERYRPTTLILLGALGAVVRWVVLACTVDLTLLWAVNWLHAASFGLTYLGGLRFVQLRVASTDRASAQGLLGAASSGVGMALGLLVGGVGYEIWGGQAFLMMALLALVGGGAAWWLRSLVAAGATGAEHD